MPLYKFEVRGFDGNDNEWIVTGSEYAAIGDFMSIPPIAMQKAFLDLTDGKATYMQPGLTCKGPFHVTKMLIELAPS
jgi:hypothetical protein